VDECEVNWQDQPSITDGGCFEIRDDGVYRSHVYREGDKDTAEIYLYDTNIESFLTRYEGID